MHVDWNAADRNAVWQVIHLYVSGSLVSVWFTCLVHLYVSDSLVCVVVMNMWLWASSMALSFDCQLL
jgi:hypothetical protein